MKKILLCAVVLFTASVNAQNRLNIIPTPASVQIGKGTFTINKNTTIVMEGSGMEKIAAYLNHYLSVNYGYRLKYSSQFNDPNSIVLNYERLDADIEGAYNFTVDKKGVYIAGDNATGVFYGVQTLIQLLPVKRTVLLNIPYVTIKDQPRFKYRGMMLDVCRHFFPVPVVKKYIDYLALHKINTFHWHLTDDQGWRIEIKKYPRLTEIGGWRNGTIIGRYPGTGNDSLKHGGFYTQDEIKEVIQYAAERYITVLPEIEMPGHASAAIAAYPQLSCFPEEDTQFPKDGVWSGPTKGKQVQQTWGVFEDVFCPSDYTFKFLQDVLDEVIALFPYEYIHIGGDECPKESWKRSTFCQELIKKEGLKDEHGLQSYFIQRMEKYINSKGKKIIGWDEILEGGLAPNATVMSWRGEEGGIEAAKQNHDVVMTPGGYVYFDHSQAKTEDSVTIGGFVPIEKVYSYNPVPDALNAEQGKHVLGAQANVWTEYIGNPSKLEYSIFPRMAALSEVLWTPLDKKDSADFVRRLPIQLQRYDMWKANYSKAFYELDARVLPTDNFNGVLWKVESKIHDSIGVNTNAVNIKSVYKQPLLVSANTTLTATSLKYKTTVSQQFFFNKATGKKITLSNAPHKNYPGDGAFTLVNGIQNDKGMLKTNEFVAWNGDDCEAVIDLGTAQEIKTVTVHTLDQHKSWIWRPALVEVFSSEDGKTFNSIGLIDNYVKRENNTGIMTVSLVKSATTRYLKVLVKNYGPIPDNEVGDGNPSWLFVSEIEVQ